MDILEKNTRIQVVDDYVFEQVKPYKNFVYWVWKNENCNVSLHTEGEYELQFKNEINASASISPFKSAKSEYDSSLTKKKKELYPALQGE
ncbi:hypothetical protein MXB_3769 [Myxobolus squamalis]|nr:hypothetical protein MXB_3769 [Myxobolus squamalis]